MYAIAAYQRNLYFGDSSKDGIRGSAKMNLSKHFQSETVLYSDGNARSSFHQNDTASSERVGYFDASKMTTTSRHDNAKLGAMYSANDSPKETASKMSFRDSAEKN